MASIIPASPALLTPAEVADLLRVNRNTVLRWAESGRLHPIRLTAGTWRFRAEEVRALLDANQDFGAPSGAESAADTAA